MKSVFYMNKISMVKHIVEISDGKRFLPSLIVEDVRFADANKGILSCSARRITERSVTMFTKTEELLINQRDLSLEEVEDIFGESGCASEYALFDRRFLILPSEHITLLMESEKTNILRR